MTEQVSVAIPVRKDQEWNRDRATALPSGTPILIAEHDEGEWASALNDAVKAAKTPLVAISGPDVWWQRVPTESLDFLADLCWDASCTYPQLIIYRDGEPQYLIRSELFCRNRLLLENYLPSVAVVRRDKFLEIGGVTSGLWDLWVRMSARGRFKSVPEAYAAREDIPDDPSPDPERTRSKATFYYQATPGTAYWRCLLPARELPGHCVFVGPRREEGPDGRLRLPQQEGAAVFQYAGNLEGRVVMHALRQQGIKTLVEVDDDYTKWTPEKMKRAGWLRNVADGAENAFSVEHHNTLLPEADGVIVTTEHLAKQYRDFNENVYVCPNQIDPADWPELDKPDDGKFRIGWFASMSHQGDGKLIQRALDWASRQPDVEVVLGGVGATNGKAWYSFPFKHYPWSNDLGVYRRFMLDLDVGLAPVVGTPWARCRSDLKALEYAMAGALPVVSDQPPYENCEMPGLVRCPDAKAFLNAVQWCVANRDEVKQLAVEARDYVLAERTVKKNINLWEQAIA